MTIKITKAELEKLSTTHTYKELGKMFGCSGMTISNYLNKFGIKKRRPVGRPNKFIIE